MFFDLNEIKYDSNFPSILEDLNNFWQEERAKRQHFYNLVHEDTKAEFINGEIIFHSPVKNKHWVACTRIAARLTVYVDDHLLGLVGVEKVMITCGRNDYEPDVVFFGKAKAAEFTRNQLLFPPPDLAVEVLSDSTRKTDYGVKFKDYAQHQITEYWIVDTDNQSVEQYFLDKNNEYVLHQKLVGEGLLKSKAIEGFVIEISSIF
jgi:Uma2 family endonuclease